MSATAVADGDGREKRSRAVQPDTPDPVLEPPPSPEFGDNYYCLWYRQDNDVKRWKMVGGIFDSWGEADEFARRDSSRRAREYVILPRGEVPHAGFSHK